MLSAALNQQDWHLECQPPALEAPPKKHRIIDYRLEGARLCLNLDFGNGRELTVACEIKDVYLEGRFGSMHEEPRMFKITCANIPDTKCLRICLGMPDSYWREVFYSCVGLVFVRDKNAPPGWPIPESLTAQPYGLHEHLRRHGTGDNMLRTTRFAQPQALRVGDLLATGCRVLSPPRWGYNSSILVHLTGGHTGHWIKMAPRLPIALLTPEDDAPAAFWNLK
jgi:hypothetical protein